ncbi:hypothetical protein [Streptomyces sp. NPDC015680]
MTHPALPDPKPLTFVVDEASEVLRTHPEAAAARRGERQRC